MCPNVCPVHFYPVDENFKMWKGEEGIIGCDIDILERRGINCANNSLQVCHTSLKIKEGKSWEENAFAIWQYGKVVIGGRAEMK